MTECTDYENIAVCYTLPASDSSKWQEVINFALSEQNKGAQTINSDTFSPFFVKEPMAHDIDKEMSLFILACTFIEYIYNKHIPYIPRKVFLYFLNNLYPGQKSSDEKWENISFDEMILILRMELSILLSETEHSCIYNPLGGPALLSCLSPQSTSCIANTNSRICYFLGLMFQLLSEETNLKEWSAYSPTVKPGQSYQAILLNIAQDNLCQRSESFFSLEVEFMQKYLQCLDVDGDMVCTLYKPYNRIHKQKLDPIIKLLVENDWIEQIISFQGNLVLLHIKKRKDKRSNPLIKIKQIEKKPGYSMNYGDWVSHLKDRTIYTISPNELKNDIYYFSPSPLFRRKEKIMHQKGLKFVKLASLLKPLQPSSFAENPPQISLNNYLSGKVKKPHYPLHPYLTAKDGEETPFQRNDYCLEEEALIIPHLIYNRGGGDKLIPYLFDPSEGNACFTGSAFAINTNLVDPEYLIMEMNKKYFEIQVRDSKILDLINENIEVFESLFLQLGVSIPDIKTSLERQKQDVNFARYTHLRNTGLDIGVDFSTISNNQDTDLQPETSLFNGRYIVKKILGRGGFGRTYLVKKKESSRGTKSYLALKEFFVNGYQKRNTQTHEVIPNLNNNLHLLENARKKFHREASIIKEFSDCPNIIKVFDVFDENGTTYYTMEYMENGDLCNYCKLMGQNGILEEFDAKRIIREVANALSTMHHHKFNHLDVKPSNILIDNDGHAKLIDFGTVKFFGNDATTTTCNMSSPGYSAPEMYQLKEFSPQADIYSLGATLRYMLEGDATHADCSGFGLPKPTISTRLKALIDQCLDNEPSCRPKDVEDFLKRLDCC